MKSTSRALYLPFGRPNFGPREISEAVRVLRSGWIGMGAETLAFERELAKAVQASCLVSVNSCTSALFLALLVSGVEKGDEVICPSLTWCSTANAACYLGARPVFCEIDASSLCVTPETIQAKVTRRTRAVVVVHFGGRAVDVDALRRVLPRRVSIIEDAAHALGAAYPNGRPVGSSGNLVCFSFYPNKNLATAEGGAIALGDEKRAKHLQSLRQHALPVSAWKRFTDPRSLLLSPEIAELGYKMNFTDLQACIARVQLQRQPEFARVRLAIARVYARRLSAVNPLLQFQDEVCSPHHARHLFTVRLPASAGRFERNRLLLDLRKRNIGATIHYAPLHRMPLYRTRDNDLPVTDHVCDRIFTLPIGSCMSPKDAEFVSETIITLLARRRLLRQRTKKT